MAGIGFRLKKLLDQKSYMDTLKAYLYAAFLSSGPWLITILVIGLIGIFQSGYISIPKAFLFRACVTYVFAFSLVGFGIIQMPLTRYLADLLYKMDTDMYLPTYAGALIAVGIFQSIVAMPLIFLVSGWAARFAFHVYCLYMAVNFVWVAMVFLSTAKDYTAIAAAFVFGGAVSVGASILLGRSAMGLDGYFIGFTAGQMIIFFGLTARVMVEFPSRLELNFDFLHHARKFPALVLIGFLYNAGIWIDKFLFWFLPGGQKVDSFLYANFIYDVPMFLSYLTIVPAMAIFVLSVETSFYAHYKNYYGAVVGKSGMKTILSAKSAMLANMNTTVSKLLVLQGLITLIAIVAVPYAVGPLRLTWLHTAVLRIGILAAFLHVLMLFVIIGMLYFEFRLEALIVTASFFILNALMTWLSIALGAMFYGYGYFSACFLSLMIGVFVFDYKLKRLEYITFMKQPVG